MKKLLSSVVLVLLGMALMYGALRYHIVTTNKGRLWLPKKELALKDTRVDVTQWKTEDLRTHPEVVRALMDHGHEDVIAHLIAEDAKSKIKDLFQGLLTK